MGKKEIFCFIKFPKTTFILIVSKADFESSKFKKLIMPQRQMFWKEKKKGPLQSELCYLTEVNRDRPNQQA